MAILKSALPDRVLMVQILASFARLAKSGQLESLAVVAVTGAEVTNAVHVPLAANAYTLLGATTELTRRIQRDYIDRDLEPPAAPPTPPRLVS